MAAITMKASPPNAEPTISGNRSCTISERSPAKEGRQSVIFLYIVFIVMKSSNTILTFEHTLPKCLLRALQLQPTNIQKCPLSPV